MIPGYLKQKDVSECIDKVCAQYTKASNNIFRFKEIIDEQQYNASGDNDNDNDQKKDDDVDIKFNFVLFKKLDNILKYDGPGGILGRGGNGFVNFDLSERWVIGYDSNDQKELSDINDIKTWKRGQPTISLYYTALHELGHTLGLDHSQNYKDVMSPWYNPKQTELTKNDIRRLKVVIKEKKIRKNKLKIKKK